MRVAKIRRLNARRTAENLPKRSSDRRSAESFEPSLSPAAMGLPRDAADSSDPPDSPLRVESELREVPLFLRRRRL